VANLHGIHHGRVTLETVDSALANLIKEIVKGYAENKDLKNLIGVSEAFQNQRGADPRTEFI
jgi:hypothetical protein